MKHIKSISEYIKESLELSEDQLMSQKEPNWKIVKDFLAAGEDNEDPLLYKGDMVFFDEVGKRLVVIDGGNPGMIVDLSLDELKDYAVEI